MLKNKSHRNPLNERNLKMQETEMSVAFPWPKKTVMEKLVFQAVLLTLWRVTRQ